MLDASDPDAAAASASATPFPTLMGDGVGDADMMRMSMAANEWMAFAMVTVGSFLLIGSCLAYWRAVRSVLFLSSLPSRCTTPVLTLSSVQVRSGDP